MSHCSSVSEANSGFHAKLGELPWFIHFFHSFCLTNQPLPSLPISLLFLPLNPFSPIHAYRHDPSWHLTTHCVVSACLNNQLHCSKSFHHFSTLHPVGITIPPQHIIFSHFAFHIISLFHTWISFASNMFLRMSVSFVPIPCFLDKAKWVFVSHSKISILTSPQIPGLCPPQ